MRLVFYKRSDTVLTDEALTRLKIFAILKSTKPKWVENYAKQGYSYF